MLYHTKQELLSAIRLAIEELDKGNPDYEDIACLLDECSEMLAPEIEYLKARIHHGSSHPAR